MFRKTTLLLISLSLFASTSFAKESDKSAPLNIWADKFVANKKAKTASYTGNVKFEHGSIKIICDELTVEYSNNDKVKRLFMQSENIASFEQLNDQDELSKASAQKIEYLHKKSLITFQGDAEVKQGDNVFKAQSIVYNTESSSIVSNGNGNAKDNTANKPGRVFISINPN